jgi:hypothetical protein
MVAGLQWDGRSGFITADAYLYGQNSPVAAIPHTGSATYDVSIGGIAMPAGTSMQSFNGIGSLRADFASGSLKTIGLYQTHAFVNSYPASLANGFGEVAGSGNWSGNARLSGNSFDGSISFDGALASSGTMKGGFFGPALENVGAVIKADLGGGGKLVATVYGAPGADISAAQNGLAALTEPTTLQGMVSSYDVTPSVSPPTSSSLGDTIEVRYDPTTNNYVVRSTLPGSTRPEVSILNADRSAAESNGKFNVYHGTTYDARVYRTGSTNPEIALTYTSFAQINQTTIVDGRSVTSSRFVTFGGLTPQFQMPKTGIATYSGIVYGEGNDSQFANKALLSGTSRLTTDFGSGATSLSMNILSTDSVSGASRALGTFAYSAPDHGLGTNRFSLNAAYNAGFSGTVIGQFNGLDASEFGATFALRIPANGQSVYDSIFAGLAVGKRD